MREWFPGHNHELYNKTFTLASLLHKPYRILKYTPIMTVLNYSHKNMMSCIRQFQAGIGDAFTKINYIINTGMYTITLGSNYSHPINHYRAPRGTNAD